MMPSKPSFVPREYLDVPGFFGIHEEPTWKYAVGLTDAIHLARAREQHDLAYLIWLQRTEHKNSIEDMASTFGQRRENLWNKLKGKTPATEDDLIRWAWLVGEKRRSYRPEDLWEEPFLMPRFPMFRHRLQ
jgi:hypothetical protein